MDPLGFGLENYDAVGAWRTHEGRFPVDASGVLPDGHSFVGSAEMKGILKGDAPAFSRCLTEKMLPWGGDWSATTAPPWSKSPNKWPPRITAFPV
jgi:hypothetical protein